MHVKFSQLLCDFLFFSLRDFNQGSHIAFDYHAFFVFCPKTVLLSFLAFRQFGLFEESKLFVLYKLSVSYCVLIIRSGLHTFDTIVDELCIFYWSISGGEWHQVVPLPMMLLLATWLIWWPLGEKRQWPPACSLRETFSHWSLVSHLWVRLWDFVSFSVFFFFFGCTTQHVGF